LAIVLSTDIANAKKPLKKLPNVVTSFNAEGYKKYGKNFVESWLKYWPTSIRLTVFYEGEESDFEMVPGISWHPIESVEFLTDFMDSLRFPIMHGIVGDRYDINFDARMCRKVLMQAHAARKYKGKVFWIDADCVTVKHVPERFLDNCLPDDALSCFLGRDGWYYTESGFLGINTDHPLAGRFLKNYVHVPIVGTIFTQQGWHDCYAYDAIRHVMGNGPEFVNLAARVPKGTMHPFQNCAPGEFMVHLKGNRKETGQLKPEDTVV
jgi:hypothetical protein